MPTGPAHLVGLAPHDHSDIVDSRAAQNTDLSLDGRESAGLHEAFRVVAGCAVEPRALARGEDDPTHLFTPSGRAADLARPIAVRLDTPRRLKAAGHLSYLGNVVGAVALPDRDGEEQCEIHHASKRCL